MVIKTEVIKTINGKQVSTTCETVHKKLATVTKVVDEGHGMLHVELIGIDGRRAIVRHMLWYDSSQCPGGDEITHCEGPKLNDLYIGRLVEHIETPEGYGAITELRTVNVDEIEKLHFMV